VFIEKRLNPENAKRIYDSLKQYHYDTDGWLLYEAAKGILQTDVYSAFPAEDNSGYFENLIGHELLRWLEIAKIADKEYEQVPGGYEKLSSYMLDEESPEYVEYQNKLYVEAIKGITSRLADRQPYLLEGFWNRLAYIANDLEKGYPAREDVHEKIALEATKSVNAASEDDLTDFYSEAEIKCQIRNELYEIYMTDEMVQTLYVTDNVLDDAYRYCLEADKADNIFLAVFE
jgi:hypothetical protein